RAPLAEPADPAAPPQHPGEAAPELPELRGLLAGLLPAADLREEAAEVVRPQREDLRWAHMACAGRRGEQPRARPGEGAGGGVGLPVGEDRRPELEDVDVEALPVGAGGEGLVRAPLLLDGPLIDAGLREIDRIDRAWDREQCHRSGDEDGEHRGLPSVEVTG